MEGVGPAFINAGFVGLLGALVVRVNKVPFSGPTVAALFTMIGFALFGKTLLNCVPLIIGVSISAALVGRHPREYILIALFGTALGPVISYVAFEMGLSPAYALPLSMLIGVFTGIILPPLAITILHLHQGYNLYNVGFTAGFIGLFAASLSNAGGKDISTLVQWGEGMSIWMILIIPSLSILALAQAALLGFSRSFKEFKAIQRLSGRLPSDFTDLEGTGGALLNAGILGLLYCGFVAIVGVPFNGPVIGGLMTIMGFALFGKNVRNVVPVAVGILLAAFVFGKSLTTPWVILAFLFGTALAPLAGEFGPVVGIIAGFLHLAMAERTSAWHGGMNLYNNGFASGLTATLIVSVMEWYKTNVEK